MLDWRPDLARPPPHRIKLGHYRAAATCAAATPAAVGGRENDLPLSPFRYRLPKTARELRARGEKTGP